MPRVPRSPRPKPDRSRRSGVQITRPTLPPAAADRVVIVGAGPAGMATAIELAQHGVPSTVLEKRGPDGTRAPLFAVIPPFADRLAALDPEGSLTSLLTPMASMDSVHVPTGRRAERPFDGDLAPDAARSRGSIDAIVAAAGDAAAAGADRRRWATVGIDDVENGLRQLARTQYADLIDLRSDAPVVEIRQGDGWAEALVRGAGGMTDAVRGALLVDASGRDLLGGARTVYPERANWLGTRLDPDGQQAGTHRVRDAEPGPTTSTIALRSRDRTIVWGQLAQDAPPIAPEHAHEFVQRRAEQVGVTTPVPADAPTMPVAVQLWTSDEPARGRVLKVGDAVRAPYFMTSTGAATALVHDAPAAVDAILAVRAGGDVAAAVVGYADAVRGANAKLIDLVRPRLLKDLGIDPTAAGAPTTETVAPTRAVA